MTFERSSGLPAEPAPTPGAADPIASGEASAGPTPVQVRLQILSTEHWSLLASRSLAWNETFSRAGMYLSTLSGAMVALGLVAGVSGFGDAFFLFAIVLLPTLLFVGLGTWIRMGVANYHDTRTVYGMNRIRGAYLEIAPELRPYFVMGVHDDPAGIGITMAVPPNTPTLVHMFASTPFLLVVLNAVVSGGIAALVVARLLPDRATAAVLGAVVVAGLVLAVQMVLARRRIRSSRQSIRPLFPTPGVAPDLDPVFGTPLRHGPGNPPGGDAAPR